MDTHVLIFVEGDTDYEFYRSLLAVLRTLLDGKQWSAKSIKTYNIAGIGNYKTDALIQYNEVKKNAKKKSGDKFKIIVALCYDSDVFEYDKKPPVDMKRVAAVLKENGAAKVIHVKAVHSIEDWFLSDTQGIKDYFGEKVKIRNSNKSGYEILKALFKTKNKIYYKGKKVTDLLERLNMLTILENNYDRLRELCSILGVDVYKK